MEAFAGLYTKQKESEQAKNSQWLTPHMFYYHILLHNVVEGDSVRCGRDVCVRVCICTIHVRCVCACLYMYYTCEMCVCVFVYVLYM